MGVDRLSVRAQMSKTRRGTSGSRALFRDGRFPQTGVKLERSYYPAVICICVKHDPCRRGRKTAKSRPTSAEEVSGYIRKRIRKTVCACVCARMYMLILELSETRERMKKAWVSYRIYFGCRLLLFRELAVTNSTLTLNGVM